MAGVTLRVIGRRAVVGECRITENERVELCAQQGGPSHRQVTLYTTSIIAEVAAFSLFWETNPDRVSRTCPEE